MAQFHLPIFGRKRRKVSDTGANGYHCDTTDELRRKLKIVESFTDERRHAFSAIVVRNEELYRQMVDEDLQRRK